MSTRFVQRNWLHFAIWIGMLVYVAAATPFYARYILKDGKPIAFDEQLPPKTKRISFSADRFDQVVFHGQNLYNLWGWAFVTRDPTSTAYERLLVLQSDVHTYYFPISDNSRSDVQKLYPDLDLPLNTGFSVYISKDAIAHGTYRIGFLFMNRENDTRYFRLTGKKIVRTPNKLQLIAP